ncbi:MAG: transposase, partial [Chitinophagales bacterium]
MAEEVKSIEKEILNIINTEPQLKKNYELIQSVPGIGAVIAAYIVIYTENFTKFADARKFASYCGIAPYEYESGSSIKGKTKISSFGYKRLKSLLFMGAMSASKNCPELHLYYKRRLKVGKKPMDVFNAIKNKMIHRVFAVIRRQSPYLALDGYYTLKK